MSKQNERLWDELARNGVLCSQPRLHLTPQKAMAYLNRHGHYGQDLSGKKVLCLASGGRQQSVAFALLDAEVTIVDFSEEQLKKERLVSQIYDRAIRIVKSDMRDLSQFEVAEFDIVYQPHSINYVPDILTVFDAISRVLRPGGLYDLMLHNPYVHGTWKNGCWEGEWQAAEIWQGKGYPIWQPYCNGYPIQIVNPHWRFNDPNGNAVSIPSPQEYRHTLSTVLNGLLSRSFQLLRFEEEEGTDFDAPPGTWEHYQSCVPPWLYVLSRKGL
ncbi:MAG: class I SAM-dependent methyltransferase [Bacteroidota bacterium]